jgi:hypothetical protein
VYPAAPDRWGDAPAAHPAGRVDSAEGDSRSEAPRLGAGGRSSHLSHRHFFQCQVGSRMCHMHDRRVPPCILGADNRWSILADQSIHCQRTLVV